MHALRWRAHLLGPNFFPSPYTDLEFDSAYDLESNVSSRVPEGETLKVAALWGIEVFGPSEAESLYSALRTLGWSAGLSSEREGALTWAEQQRTYGWGGVYNVGVVGRAKASALSHLGNHSPLPEGVDCLLVRLHQITPAVTCALVCFVFDDDAATVYARELGKDRSAWFERRGRMVSRWDPAAVKERELKAARARLRGMVTTWFREHLPGYFSGMRDLSRFPVAELLSTEIDSLFPGERVSGRQLDWRRRVARARSFEVWSNTKPSGIRFSLRSQEWPKASDNVLIASVVPRLLPEGQVRLYNHNPRSTAFICHNALDGAVVYFGLLSFLSEVSRDLKSTREELDLSKGKQGALRTVELIRRFFDRSAGMPAVVRELREELSKPGMLEHHSSTFTAPGWTEKDPVRDFMSEIRRGVQQRASTLLEDEAAAREHFGQLSTILATRESIRVQRRMEVLTVLALVVALLSLAAAVPDAWVERARQLIAGSL